MWLERKARKNLQLKAEQNFLTAQELEAVSIIFLLEYSNQ